MTLVRLGGQDAKLEVNSEWFSSLKNGGRWEEDPGSLACFRVWGERWSLWKGENSLLNFRRVTKMGQLTSIEVHSSNDQNISKASESLMHWTLIIRSRCWWRCLVGTWPERQPFSRQRHINSNWNVKSPTFKVCGLFGSFSAVYIYIYIHIILIDAFFSQTATLLDLGISRFWRKNYLFHSNKTKIPLWNLSRQRPGRMPVCALTAKRLHRPLKSWPEQWRKGPRFVV